MAALIKQRRARTLNPRGNDRISSTRFAPKMAQVRRIYDTFSLLRVTVNPPGMGIDGSIAVEGPSDQGDPASLGETNRLGRRERPGDNDLDSTPHRLVDDVPADPTGEHHDALGKRQLGEHRPADELVDGIVAAKVREKHSRCVSIVMQSAKMAAIRG